MVGDGQTETAITIEILKPSSQHWFHCSHHPLIFWLPFSSPDYIPTSGFHVVEENILDNSCGFLLFLAASESVWLYTSVEAVLVTSRATKGS